MQPDEPAILFVCLGNICRSPLAEAIAKKKFAAIGRHPLIASAGTGDWHVGHGADPRACAAGRAQGYTLDAHRASQVQVADFNRYDLLLAMDQQNFADLEALQPAAARGAVHLLLDYAAVRTPVEVPDPYFGDEAGFDACVQLLEDAVDGLLRRVTSVRGD